MALVVRKLKLIDWSEPKTKVCGYLLRADRVQYEDGKDGMRYLVKSKLGVIIAFKGVTQLNMLLQRNDLGRYIEVAYIGEDTSREVKEGRNRAKLFEVAVDEDDMIEGGNAGYQGVDEDIPF